ncbi:helix-turn-helix domain-containing protein [Chryseobacterium sp. MEBOG06]|uniref:helix-turn-helix domain-containing protein n=1 Tax=unclassified Chryseobacterium TaxID=2593645 RepID=UPI001F34F535|nr:MULTISPECIES: helix-turn-helix transcriptional regulator [unclassified Chryseobacterium]UKB86361.1 helix-turn-helix domain-containing protein [Chryseobacterium sp. MEBOG06]
MFNPPKIHQGRNIKRFREILGIKQEALAFDLGEDWNQKKVSLLEQKEIIEDQLLRKISEIMKIPVEAFQNFDEEQTINIISNTFHEGSIAHATAENIQYIFNLLEKMAELYERMLKEKDETITRLESLLKHK